MNGKSLEFFTQFFEVYSYAEKENQRITLSRDLPKNQFSLFIYLFFTRNHHPFLNQSLSQL